MSLEQFANLAATTLNGAINNSTTTVIVTSASLFPAAGQFRILIDSEIMIVTAVSTNTFTVTRGAEGTTGASHLDLAPVTHILTAASLIKFGTDVMDTSLAQGRLTLTSALPVTTSDVTAATTIYYTPYTGNRIALYYGSQWLAYPFAELSVAVPSNTNTPFDLFVYWTGTAVALEAVAWTNATTRATALTTQDGVYVKTGATDRKYVGTACTTGSSGQCEDSNANRLVWNMFHRKRRKLRIVDATTSWSYSSATIRAANGTTTGHTINVVTGIAEEAVNLAIFQRTSTAGLPIIGVNSTTINSGDNFNVGTGASDLVRSSTLVHVPAAGLTTYNWNEAAYNGASTFYATNSNTDLASLSGWCQA